MALCPEAGKVLAAIGPETPVKAAIGLTPARLRGRIEPVGFQLYLLRTPVESISAPKLFGLKKPVGVEVATPVPKTHSLLLPTKVTLWVKFPSTGMLKLMELTNIPLMTHVPLGGPP